MSTGQYFVRKSKVRNSALPGEAFWGLFFLVGIDRPSRPVNPQDSSPRFRAGHSLMLS
jgi:hypothetical protein